MKITIYCDPQSEKEINQLGLLNPQVKKAYIYEALLIWALENMPERITTNRAGLKVPQGMSVLLRGFDGLQLPAAPQAPAEPQPEKPLTEWQRRKARKLAASSAAEISKKPAKKRSAKK